MAILRPQYRYGLDFINGANTIDLGGGYAKVLWNFTAGAYIWDQAYALTLLAPLQLRTLQPDWYDLLWLTCCMVG